MSKRLTNIFNTPYEENASTRGEANWRSLNLSGDHLGVRVEELPPGNTSSYHHYHVTEEEHVVVLEGTATLRLGEEAIPISKGDHMVFRAGEELPHHIENTSNAAFSYLVFGEHKTDEVVFYPKSAIALVNLPDGPRWYNYQPHIPEE